MALAVKRNKKDKRNVCSMLLMTVLKIKWG